MHRPTLSTFIELCTNAAMEAVAASSEAFKARWLRLTKEKIFVQIGKSSIQMPAVVLEPDAYPYPKSLKFKTEMRIHTYNEKIEIVSAGKSFGLFTQPIQIEIKYTFGAVPEAYALEREHENSNLSTQLDKAKP